MNKIILYKGIYKCFDYTFDNLTDLLSYIETAPVNENKFLRRASEEGSKSFTGTSSLKESINLCRSGWNEGFDDFLLKKEKLDRKFPILYDKYAVRNDIIGSMPNVQRYLMGLPDNMRRAVRDDKEQFVKIYFNLACSAATSIEKIKNRGIITLSLIDFFESLGYRVSLNFFDLSETGDEVICVNINIKELSEKLNIKKCYFPMVNPSMLRRLSFRVTETVQGIEESWNIGYGRPSDIDFVKQYWC